MLHDITNCLRIGDLSVIHPEGIQTFELKRVKGKRKADRRERRQIRRGKIVREFYDRGISTRILPGMKSVMKIGKKRDKHNWNEMCTVIKETIENGYGMRLVEECMIYFAFRGEELNEELLDELVRFIRKKFKDPNLMLGFQGRHIFGISTIMPFTCFEISLPYKEKLLFKEVGFCVLLDLNSLCRTIEESGLHCKLLKDSCPAILEVSIVAKGKMIPCPIGYSLIYRMLYECLSFKTLLYYTKVMSEERIKHEMLK